MGGIQMTQPEVLGRNGTYVVFRKLHQRVAAFRRYLKANSTSPEEEELLAAKLMGRWRSGAPLALCPVHDDPALGADPRRNNNFIRRPAGFKTPGGSHIRRTNPRDASVAGVPRIHRMIRRGTAYGPLLPEGVLEDDGADRGLMFAFVGAHLGRQFEFVQSQWINDGVFIGAGDANPSSGRTVGATASRFHGGRCRRLLTSHGLSSRAVNVFSRTAGLRWLADLQA
jgi:Dyp-type peroxidase family